MNYLAVLPLKILDTHCRVMDIMCGDVMMFVVDKVAQYYVLLKFHQFFSTNHHHHHHLFSSVLNGHMIYTYNFLKFRTSICDLKSGWPQS